MFHSHKQGILSLCFTGLKSARSHNTTPFWAFELLQNLLNHCRSLKSYFILLHKPNSLQIVYFREKERLRISLWWMGTLPSFFKLRFILEVVFYEIDAFFLHLNQIVTNDCPFIYLCFVMSKCYRKSMFHSNYLGG